VRTVLALYALCALAACERDPLDIDCPELAAGDLVLSEIHEQYIEVYNAGAATVDLGGAVITLQNIAGGDPDRMIVRTHGVDVAAGDYAVLGRSADDAFVDYAYTVDFDQDLYDNAELRIEACGVEIDRVVYRSLPNDGSLAFDGGMAPSAADNDNANANDTESDWCIDATDAIGTPGVANTPCA
jgi:hypothetical protein